MNSEQNRQVLEEIKARTKQTAYSLKINKDKQPGIFDSKFGGAPYWDMNKDYPTDNAGKKLMLLAQINLDNAGVDERLPGQGMLQFFTGVDDVFGADFDNPDNQNTFRVIYHEKIDYTTTKEQVLAINPPISTEPDNEFYTPVLKEAAVEIIKKEIYMGDGDYRFEQLFSDIVSEKFGYNIGKQTAYSFLGNDAYEELMEELKNEGHWLFGYPYFTQYDPRDTEDYKYYDTLLFQMDSDYIDSEDYVLWGDCGVANFFINSEDLKRRDFSKVLYNWDCC